MTSAVPGVMRSICLVLVLGCAPDSSIPRDSLVEDFDDSDANADVTTPRVVYCDTTDAAAGLVKLRFTPDAATFAIDAQTDAGTTFALVDQRPSLNLRVQEVDSIVPVEFVDFRPSGLVALPAVGTTRLELDLASGAKPLLYADGSTQVKLQCRVSATRLLAYLGIAPTTWPRDVADAKRVGFDIDDTLVAATPTFDRGLATGASFADPVFWTEVNRCDRGCAAQELVLPDGTMKALPATARSGVKARAAELVAYHKARGAEVYAITGRPDIHGEPLRAYLEQELGIPADHVFFEPDIVQPGNSPGKSDRIQQLALDLYYGDSDSDITDALKVNVRGIRVLRSPTSSYRRDGRFAKYHPGYYGETIVAGSYD